ncbi:hypothetical protein DFQ30_009709 [Apophysomyces sp. BC1015]|nr:hypothetical protein DFQ30_009709 [Apophysomyces sp. BC1015]
MGRAERERRRCELEAESLNDVVAENMIERDQNNPNLYRMRSFASKEVTYEVVCEDDNTVCCNCPDFLWRKTAASIFTWYIECLTCKLLMTQVLVQHPPSNAMHEEQAWREELQQQLQAQLDVLGNTNTRLTS